MKAKVKPALPKGFTAIMGGGDSWDFKKNRELQGVVTEVKTIDRKNARKGESPTMRLLRVKTKEGEVTVWEKAALRGLFDMPKLKGKQVAIVYLGTKKIPGRKQPMHDFASGIK